MEFDHVGAHCNAPGCGQQDFLPFVCPGCTLPMCMEHRAPATHSCSRTAAAGQKDVISVECPLCLTSIKMDRQEDPNSAFEQHLSSSCAKAAAARPSPSSCPAPGCGVRLGPSNAFQCNRCNNRVCMSHRMPEDHGCASHRNERAARAAFAASARAEGKGTAATKRPETKVSSNASQKPPSTSTLPRNLPAVAGTTSRGTNSASTGPRRAEGEAFQCPMCDKPFASSNEVARHVESAHLCRDITTDGGTVSLAASFPPPPPRAATAPANARQDNEVCVAETANVIYFHRNVCIVTALPPLRHDLLGRCSTSEPRGDRARQRVRPGQQQQLFCSPRKC
jgi:hypothetical protein